MVGFFCAFTAVEHHRGRKKRTQTHIFHVSSLCDRDLALFSFSVHPLNVNLLCQTFLHVSVKMLVQVKHIQQQKYVKLDEVEGRFDFLQFHEKGANLDLRWNGFCEGKML